MDERRRTPSDKVTIMTIHAAKGLEFDTVFLPGWEEGVFPSSARSTKAAAPASRRSAASPMSASPARGASATIFHAANRRIYGLWTVDHPLPLRRRTARGAYRGDGSAGSYRYGGYGGLALRQHASRSPPPTRRRAGSARRPTAPTPDGRSCGSRFGHQRSAHVGYGETAAASRGLCRLRGSGRTSREAPPPRYRGELVAKSSGSLGLRRRRPRVPSQVRQRHHPAVDGNKLTIDFDKAGRKMVLDSFVQERGSLSTNGAITFVIVEALCRAGRLGFVFSSDPPDFFLAG